MFIISEYLNPENIPQDQAESLFQQHAEWFTKHFNLGHFVLVGPYLDIPKAGVMLSNLNSREELDAILAEDVFAKDNMARYEVHEFKVAMVSTITAE
ncbi:YciI family protein [uncultured Megasphaera sp.]|uniref:YciI family protein n=1 Tax=Megasphaera massiliensis TaxID=1232428 RepID=UPI00266C266F|nr:YciI family protein [uncultured Megasphaera sp.]